MATYELNIDGSGAEAGAQRIVKSFDSIKAASDRMEGGVVASAKRVTAAFSQMSSVRGVSREAVESLNLLSKVLGSFRGPSKAAIENTSSFLSAMRGFSGFRAPSSAGLASFLTALSRFSGPTPLAGRNTESLLRALSGFSGISGLGTRLNAFLSVLAGFRGPSANAARNTEALLRVLSSFTAPRGFSAAVTGLMEIAAAADRAAAALKSAHSAASGSCNIKSSGSALAGGVASSGAARTAGRDAERAALSFGAMEGAVLRTNTALSSLGGILALRSIIGASNAVLAMRAQLSAATGSVQQANVQFGYLLEVADRLGLELVSVAKSYGMFLGSIKGTNVTLAQGKEIFEGFATAGRALQLSNEDLDGVFRALGQMLSKGKLQAEELRGQLGDRLPGAFVRFAKALHMMKPGELDNALKKGAISGDILTKAIIDVADSLKVEFAPGAERAAKTVDAAFNRMKNSFTLAAAGLGTSGLNQGVIDITVAIRKLLDSTALSVFLQNLGGAIKFAAENINFLASLLAGYAAVSLTKYLFGITGVTAALAKNAAASAAAALAAEELAAADAAATEGEVANAFASTAKGAALIEAAAAAAAEAGATAAATVSTGIFTTAYTAMVAVVSLALAPIEADTVAFVGLTLATETAAGAAGAVAGVFALVGAAAEALWVILLANPWIALATVVAAVTLAFLAFKSSQEDFAKQMRDINTTTADADNMIDDYTAHVLDMTGKVDANTEALRENTLKKLENARAGLALNSLDIASTTKIGSIFGYDASIDSRGGKDIRVGNTVLRGAALQEVMKMGHMVNGEFTLYPVDNAVNFGRAIRQSNYAGALVKGELIPDSAQSAALGKIVERRKAQINATLEEQRAHFDVGFNAQAVATREAGGRDYNLAAGGEGLSGALAKKQTAAEKAAARAAAAAKKADAADVRKAIKFDADQQREIDSATSSTAISQDYLSGGKGGTYDSYESARIAQEARGKAEQKFAGIEASFDPKRIESETMQYAAALKGLDPAFAGVQDNYKATKEAIIDYMATQQEEVEQTKKLAAVMDSTAQLKQQNDYQQTGLQAIVAGGAAAERLNVQLEVEKRLSGLNAENRAKALEYTTEQVQREIELNKLAGVAADVHATILASQKMSDSAPLYTMGLNPKDLEMYKTLVEYRRQLMDDNIPTQVANDAIAVKQSALTQERVNNDLMDQYTKMRQLAEDQADAIVGGFRDAIESGKSFGDTMKSIFANLKKLILDFVLYNPLKNFLSDMFTGTNSTRFMNQNLPGLIQAGGRDVVSLGTNLFSGLGSDGEVGRAGYSPAGTTSNFADNVTSLVNSASPGGSFLGSALSGGKQTAGVDSADIVVNAVLHPGQIAPAQINPTSTAPAGGYFSGLAKIFDAKANIGGIKGLFGGGSLGTTIGPAVQAFGNAFAAYSIGQTIGKMVGLGRVGSGILGGAAAGMTFGPVGAAIGAVLGGLQALISKPKIPHGSATLDVGPNGEIITGRVVKAVGGVKKEDVLAGATAIGSVFTDFMKQYGVTFDEGQYGRFGQYKKKTFYLAPGAHMKKGKPQGEEGVDYVYGSEDEVSTFALKRAINAGDVKGLTTSQYTVAHNSKATTMDAFQSDLGVAATYDAYIKKSFKTSALKSQIDDLNDGFKKLKDQAVALGLAESKLQEARARVMQSIKDDFNYTISQGILQITDPVQAAFNDLVKEYHDSVSDAIAAGGDLGEVERLYGLKRTEIAKQYADQANNAYKKAADALLHQLTGTTSSPLAPTTALANAASTYQGLANQINSGDYTNADQLGQYAQDYLDAARVVYSSSSQYFDIFKQVTDFLASSSQAVANGAGGPNNLPDLPSLDSLVASITADNAAQIAAVGDVGQTIVATSAETNTLLSTQNNTSSDILEVLRELLGKSSSNGTPAPQTLVTTQTLL